MASEPEVLIGWFRSLELEVTGCTRHRSAVAARLVPPSALQIAASAGSNTDHPEQGPVAGTMDQVRPMTFQQGIATARC
jgi:hypothetical protein